MSYFQNISQGKQKCSLVTVANKKMLMHNKCKAKKLRNCFTLNVKVILHSICDFSPSFPCLLDLTQLHQFFSKNAFHICITTFQV